MAVCAWGCGQESKPSTPTSLVQRLFRSDQGIVSKDACLISAVPALTKVLFGKPSGCRGPPADFVRGAGLSGRKSPFQGNVLNPPGDAGICKEKPQSQ